MKILFKNINVVSSGAYFKGFVAVDGQNIVYAGETEPQIQFDEIYDGKNKALMPGLINAHTHIPMTLFRGYAEDMPLQRWLEDKIFPAEDKLDGEAVYNGAMLGISEQIAGGITSFSDMYNFCGEIADAVLESGVRANISRGITHFDRTIKNISYENHIGLRETSELLKRFRFNRSNNSSEQEFIKIDLCIHAEYTNTDESAQFIADMAVELGAAVHIHASETRFEHEECIKRHGVTPVQWLLKQGFFKTPVLIAHGVWLSDEDMDIIKNSPGSTVAHCPVSNLKLGSGVARVIKLLEKNIPVAFGTDSAASNNTLDILHEMRLGSILQKGIYNDASALPALEVLKMATVNGATAQGRTYIGEIAVGKRADLCVIDMDKPHLQPCTNVLNNIIHAARASDVVLTMCDGKILYKDGDYKTIDIEKVKYNAATTAATIVS